MSFDELPTCGTCCWWDPIGNGDGWCRRGAPRVEEPLWPVTDPGDFCGEHPLAWKRLPPGSPALGHPQWIVPDEPEPDST